MSDTYKDHRHPPGWENDRDPNCQACAESELASSAGSSSVPWWAWLFIAPLAIILSPIGTIILTVWLHLDFAGCCKLIAGQVILFLNLAIFAGGED